MARMKKLVRAALVAAATAALVLVGVAPPAAAADGTFSGVVTVDGVPTAGLLVQAIPDAPGPFQTDTTDALGQFEITTAPGSYQVQVFDLSEEYQNEPVPFTTLGDGAAVTVNIPLTRWPVGTATVNGLIEDLLTLTPIENATVRLNGGTGVRPQEVATSVNGLYTFSNVIQTTVSVFASAPGYRSEFADFPVLDGEIVPRNFQLKPLNATISGIVLDGGGNPISGLNVSGHPTDGSNGNVNTTTDGTGAYSLSPIAPGEYEVSIGGPGTAWVAQTSTLTVDPASTATRNFVLVPRSVGSLSGVVNGPGGVTLAKICVDAYDASGVVVGANAMAGTGPDGAWTIEDLDAGTYRLFYWDCDYTRVPAYASTFTGGGGALATASTTPVTAGVDTTGLTITLALGATIQGVIQVQTPDAVIDFPGGRGMDATVYQLVGGVWEPVPDPSPLVSGTPGVTYEVRGLLPGTYRVGFIDSNVTGSRAYESEFYEDQPTVATAADVVVSGSATVTLNDVAVAITRPDGTPFALSTSMLLPGFEDDIDLETENVQQGQFIEVQVDPALAGEWVSVWGHSDPVLLGSDWVQVGSTGLVRVQVPLALPAGEHLVAVQDADGELVGWTGGLEVSAAPGGLANTGATTLWLVPAGVLVLLLGAALVVARRASRA